MKSVLPSSTASRSTLPYLLTAVLLTWVNTMSQKCISIILGSSPHLETEKQGFLWTHSLPPPHLACTLLLTIDQVSLFLGLLLLLPHKAKPQFLCCLFPRLFLVVFSPSHQLQVLHLPCKRVLYFYWEKRIFKDIPIFQQKADKVSAAIKDGVLKHTSILIDSCGTHLEKSNMGRQRSMWTSSELYNIWRKHLVQRYFQTNISFFRTSIWPLSWPHFKFAMLSFFLGIVYFYHKKNQLRRRLTSICFWTFAVILTRFTI